MACGNERAGYTCANCLANHHANLSALAGERPRACNECRVSFDDLARLDQNAAMVVVLKDGILQLLCKQCELRFTPKSPTYQKTPYAYINKLDGFR